MQPSVMSHLYDNPVVQRRVEPLTENGFTVAEETRILGVLRDVRNGAKTYSDEEAARYLGLED